MVSVSISYLNGQSIGCSHKCNKTDPRWIEKNGAKSRKHFTIITVMRAYHGLHYTCTRHHAQCTSTFLHCTWLRKTNFTVSYRVFVVNVSMQYELLGTLLFELISNWFFHLFHWLRLFNCQLFSFKNQYFAFSAKWVPTAILCFLINHVVYVRIDREEMKKK